MPKLSGNEKRELSARPTKNPDAYDAYLRGLAFEGDVQDFRASLLKSIEAFEDAVRLDPEFAVAWAHLCRQNGLAISLIMSIQSPATSGSSASSPRHGNRSSGRTWSRRNWQTASYKYLLSSVTMKAPRPNSNRFVGNIRTMRQLRNFSAGIARRQGQWEAQPLILRASH